jgi:hypothetical protein
MGFVFGLPSSANIATASTGAIGRSEHVDASASEKLVVYLPAYLPEELPTGRAKTTVGNSLIPEHIHAPILRQFARMTYRFIDSLPLPPENSEFRTGSQCKE